LNELKRRNVLRVAVAYLAGAWVLIQIADVIFPRLGLSDQAVTNLIIILAIGFVPSLILAWFFELTPSGIKRDADMDQELSPRSGKVMDRVIIVLLIFAVGFFAVDKFVLDPARDAETVEIVRQQTLEEAATAVVRDQSIAVMAFVDMSPQGDQEYFSDGIAEEILNILSSVKELRVISRSTAFSFKNSKESLTEVGEILDVSYILEGSVRKFQDKIRITAQLIDARTDAHIWSQTYDRQFDDIFAIQDEIAANIVAQAKITLLESLPESTRIDADAYDKYLKALYIVQTESRLQYREAQALLNDILELEPNYIPALNALARLYYRIPKSDDISAEENDAEIRALADRVISIAPEGIDAAVWQGWLAYVDGDYSQAAQYYEKAASIDPANTSLLRVVGAFLNDIGRPEEAIKFGRYLMQRDPSCMACRYNLSSAFESIGDYEQAVLTLEEITAWAPPGAGYFWIIGKIWLKAGQPEKAKAAFEQEEWPLLQQTGLIMALHDLGRTDEATALLEEFNTREATREIALIYLWIDHGDSAFVWLDRLIQEQGPQGLRRLLSFNVHERIESDPRWEVLLDKHGVLAEPELAVDFSFDLPGEATN
jgi:TolB-like protein/cytochrome c-type biogenesis protein CcmH/NrfG